MRLGILLALLTAVAAAIVIGQAWFPDVAAWAVRQQRAFQNEIAMAVHAIRANAPGAWLALLGAAGAYGFVHAVGPGHGKYLIGGVGLGSAVSAPRLLGMALASSLAQALWAILLVYGGLWILEISARRLTAIAETYLAGASYAAIGAIGMVLMWRGLAGLRRSARIADDHDGHQHHAACGCHAHGPRPQDVAGLRSVREAVALIVSIAMRPCTGAIFLLVIAWQLDIPWAGAAAVMTMGIGTGPLTSLVAISSVAARGLAYASSDRFGALTLAVPTLQLVSGALIIWFSMILLNVAVL